MTKLKTLLLATAAAAVLGTPAFAAQEGTYISLGAGLHMPGSSGITTTIPSNPTFIAQNATFKPGWALAGAVGYSFESYRVELEVGYRNAALNKIGGAVTSGSQRVLGVMGNALFDIGTGTNFQPYVGVGAGMGWNRWRNVLRAGTGNFNDTDSGFQFQGIVGAAYPIGPATDLYVDYRYIGMLNARFTSGPPPGTIDGHTDGSHNIMVGVRFFFGPR